jgi:AcrR family transcriptional regulator
MITFYQNYSIMSMLDVNVYMMKVLIERNTMNSTNVRYPKRENSQKTFNTIVSTAKKLFAMQGYQSTSINEIIQKSKIAAGTFYLYFDDKFALYSYLLDEYRHSIRKEISEAIKHAHTRYEKERLGIRAFLAYAWKDPLAYRIIWESLFVDPKLFKEYYMTFSQDYMKQLFKAHNEIRPHLDLETLSYMLMGISNFVGLQVMFRETLTDMDLDVITNQVMDILKHGMFQ